MITANKKKWKFNSCPSKTEAIITFRTAENSIYTFAKEYFRSALKKRTIKYNIIEKHKLMIKGRVAGKK